MNSVLKYPAKTTFRDICLEVNLTVIKGHISYNSIWTWPIFELAHKFARVLTWKCIQFNLSDKVNIIVVIIYFLQNHYTKLSIFGFSSFDITDYWWMSFITISYIVSKCFFLILTTTFPSIQFFCLAWSRRFTLNTWVIRWA